MSEKISAISRPRYFRDGFVGVARILTAFALITMTGCETVSAPPPEAVAPVATEVAAPSQAAPAPSEETILLKQGDVIKVSFPSVPGMDTTQPIRSDGRISLPMAGEVLASGQSTDSLTNHLREIYATKLVSNDVLVSLVSNAYAVYVTGAVLRPGKIMADRRITAFDAIMEAGGFDKARANLKAVVIVRQENGQSRSYTVNVQKILSGDTSEAPFYLKPFDTVYVKEKFSWF